jgi:hypothetical protein
MMLTGGSTLSFMMDPITMETSANAEARLYLKRLKKRESLLNEAFDLFSTHDRIGDSPSTFAERRLFSSHITNVYRLLFFEEELFYIHPQSPR